MEMTAALVARIPPGNLRVPRDEFAAVWVAAERRNWEQGERVAGRVHPSRRRDLPVAGRGDSEYPTGRPVPAPAPVSNCPDRAFEELIEAEYQAADLLEVRCPDLLKSQPGWCEEVRATLRRNGGFVAVVELVEVVRAVGDVDVGDGAVGLVVARAAR
jgi:hypothetical protein